VDEEEILWIDLIHLVYVPNPIRSKLRPLANQKLVEAITKDPQATLVGFTAS
jgi:hypothetical protein